MNVTFYHQTVSSKQIEDFLSQETGIDLTEFFNQYLRTTKVPTLEYTINKKTLKYRWINIVEGFDMPIQVIINDEDMWLFPKADWQTMNLESKQSTIKIDPDFYIYSQKI